MLKLLSDIARAFVRESLQATERRINEGAYLMDRANACAARDPRRAADLRTAAMGYLGVQR
ncbi:MAG: hypothetical protein QM569_07640 [Acidovorax sp.]|uniref:hypothetical protein n=1 Tax=Acidovorax sp. TaxID=1872122 RepID=UPI0039E5E07A